MKVVVQAVSAKMGGASNYLNAVATEFARQAPADEFIYLVPSAGTLEQTEHARVRKISAESVPQRLWFDRRELPKLLRQVGADVLFSTANIGIRNSPCRQVLLVRNALYFSDWYEKSILPYKGWRFPWEHRLRKSLVLRSVRWADAVVVPSHAMLASLREHVDLPGGKAIVSHYGVDAKRFAVTRTAPQSDELRLLFTGLYAEHKNLSTLFEALLLLAQQNLHWQLTTTADPEWEPAIRNRIRERDAQTARDPRIRDKIRFTGVLSSTELAALYGRADAFVYPSAVESFGHPLLEAMAARLPIVAADTAVNRELCGNAAVYFSTFDPADCARRIAELAASQAQRELLALRAQARAAEFSWSHHVSDLLRAFRGASERGEAARR